MSSRGAHLCAALIAFISFAGTASASLIASDKASDPAYATAWNSGSNGGSGWGGGWTFRDGGNVVQTNPAGTFFGRFVGDSRGNNSPAGAGGDSNSDGDINTTGSAWGMYANTSNEIYAIRPFSGQLDVGQTVRFAFDNGNVDATRVLGVRLLANASDISTRQMELRFVGGDANYSVVSGGTSPTTTVGFTREGILAEFTLTSPTAYSLTIIRPQSNTSQTVVGTLISPGGNNAINGIAFRNQATGTGATNDGYFNSISVPEPTSLGALAVGSMLLARRRRGV